MGMDLGRSYKTDADKELNGTWVDIGDGGSVKIARSGNKRYLELFQQKIKPHARAIRTKTLKNEVAEAILIDCMAQAILLDWAGLEDNGQPLKYSTAEAKRLLTDYKDFRNLITELADDMETFRQEQLEDDEKNSEV
jgi:hypothetical protein